MTRDQDIHTFEFFVDKILSPVIGKKKAKSMRAKKLLHEYCTKSDRAFAYVTLDNKWNHWEDKFEKKPVIRPPRYTNSRTLHRKFEGWTQEGIRKYNNYYLKSERESESPAGYKIEEEYLEKKKEEEENKSSKQKRRKVNDLCPDERIFPMCGAFGCQSDEDMNVIPETEQLSQQLALENDEDEEEEQSQELLGKTNGAEPV